MADKIIAHWDVAGETYQEMVQEAIADAGIFMHGSPQNYAIDVLNCTIEQVEDRRITMWKGQAIIAIKPKPQTTSSIDVAEITQFDP